MAAVLAKEGYAVTALADARAALDEVASHHFDVVISDLRLDDDADGLAVLAEAQKQNADTVTVLLTGYGSIESAMEAIRQGIFGYIVKPCRIDEMRATIAAGLQKQRASKASKQAEWARAAHAGRQLARDEYERQKDDLLAGISHDLKGPLTTIKGTVQLLQRRHKAHDGDGLADALETIDLTASRMARLIDKVGEITRMEGSPSPRPDMRESDLVVLLRRVAAEHRPTTDRHSIELHSDLDELPVVCDAVQIERVIANLLSNAIRYSPTAGTIVVTLSHDDGQEGPMAVLQVKDQGVGIPSEELPRIFDRFFRASNVCTRIPGAGIGLTGTRQIVEGHGGTISAASREGAGTVFTVRLPLARAARPERCLS